MIARRAVAKATRHFNAEADRKTVFVRRSRKGGWNGAPVIRTAITEEGLSATVVQRLAVRWRGVQQRRRCSQKSKEGGHYKAEPPSIISTAVSGRRAERSEGFEGPDFPTTHLG